MLGFFLSCAMEKWYLACLIRRRTPVQSRIALPNPLTRLAGHQRKSGRVGKNYASILSREGKANTWDVVIPFGVHQWRVRTFKNRCCGGAGIASRVVLAGFVPGDRG